MPLEDDNVFDVFDKDLQIVELNVHAQPENMFTKRGVIKSKGSNDNPINQKPGVNDISWNKIF